VPGFSTCVHSYILFVSHQASFFVLIQSSNGSLSLSLASCKMAACSVVLNDVLCFIRNKYGKTSVKQLKTALLISIMLRT